MSRATLRIALMAVLLGALLALLVVPLRVGAGAGRKVDSAAPQVPSKPLDPRRLDTLQPPFLVFRTLAPREAHGRVALLPLAVPGSARQISDLPCARLHYAGGRGICVVQETVADTPLHVAYVFDQTLGRAQRIALPGVVTRVRVAPNGQRAAITTCAEEEKPEGERLAVNTMIVDLQTGRTLADLRDFEIESPRPPQKSEFLDYSSVAFHHDSDRFFATLSTATDRYLVAGSVDQRRLTIVRAGLANEALSPDGHLLAVKWLVGDRGFWQLGVIDLQTQSERYLQQGSRSVDDQVEWLDDHHVVYHDADGDTTSLWMLPVDGVHGPRVFVKDAYSAAVQR